jgi:hypothetical protein
MPSPPTESRFASRLNESFATQSAYEQTLRALRLKDRDDPITQLVAEKIIAIGRLGIEDPAEISKLTLKELGLG